LECELVGAWALVLVLVLVLLVPCFSLLFVLAALARFVLLFEKLKLETKN